MELTTFDLSFKHNWILTKNLCYKCHKLFIEIVWTPCLMHRCVCIWRYILQNYNYKLHFQNLSIYHISHVFIGTLVKDRRRIAKTAKTLPCCAMSACIHFCMSSGFVWRIYVGFVADIDIKILGVPPRGSGMPFLDSNTCVEGGGGNLFLPWFFSLYDAIHGWMTGRMDGRTDGWMDGSHDEKRFTKNNHDVLYYM